MCTYIYMYNICLNIPQFINPSFSQLTFVLCCFQCFTITATIMNIPTSGALFTVSSLGHVTGC